MIAVVAILSSGCSSKNYSIVEIDTKKQLEDSQKTQVFFYRKLNIVGATVSPYITVDGTVVGSSVSGTGFFVDVGAGEHKVNTGVIPPGQVKITTYGKADGTPTPGYIDTGESLSFAIQPHETVCIEQSATFSENIVLKVVPCEKALKDSELVDMVRFH